MRAPAVSFAKRFVAAFMAALLTVTLLPASAFAEREDETADASTEELREVSAEQVDEGSGSTPVASTAEDRTLASALVGAPTTFVNSDVALDGEPVVGSFTVDGLTFAVTEGSDVELVGVSPGRQQVTSSQEGDGSPVAPMLASGPDGLDAGSAALTLPESVAYEGVDYAVASIGAYAFYLSGGTATELPATVTDVDDRAFRSSDVASVTVADGNPTYSSFDGALYDADRSSLLLIPEGKQGTVLLPSTAESAAPSVFSHCSLVTQVSVEEGSAAFASENGLLYDASLATLLRVPAGATDVTIRDGCTTIAAGAMEACASLATITAPASVTSISPDVFTSVPTVSLPAVSAVADDPGASTGATEGSSEQAGSTPASSSASTQLTAMVALSSADDDLPEVDSAAIKVSLPEAAVATPWEALGFAIENSAISVDLPEVEMQIALSSRARSVMTWANGLYARSSYDGLVTWYPSDRFHWPDADTNTFVFYPDATLQWNPSGGNWRVTFANPGCEFVCYSTQRTYPGGTTWTSRTFNTTLQNNVYAIWRVPITWDANGGYWGDDRSDTQSKTDTYYSNDPTSGWQGSIVPTRPGYRFAGWQSIPPVSNVSQLSFAPGEDVVVSYAVTYVAQWEQSDLDIGFDVDSEPGDEDYPGEAKDDQTIAGSQIEAGDKVEIEDPKRPGYVFQGWTIPNAEGTEAIDQDLVYQDEADGKWYVDASKLPDYANDEGRVELTARWTSVISVDVPSAVTFYADVVTQGNESREGAASSAFGQNKVASQSEVDLRIVGLESTAVVTDGTTLGADSILKKSASATPSSSTQKLFSLYPTDKALTPDDLQDPDAVSQAKPSDAVDFALDDLLLEKSFAADAFTIPAGDTLNLGYRLNLAETGTELDYDKLSTLDDGQSASIASISYTFSADLTPFWTYDDDGRKLDVAAIKADAEAIAAGDSATAAKYTAWMNDDHRFYVKWYDKGITESDDPTAATVYDVRIIGLNHDEKSDGSGKAGITFQLVDCLKDKQPMNSIASNVGGWGSALLRARLNPGIQTAVGGVDDDAIWNQIPSLVRDAIIPVTKTFSTTYSGSGTLSSSQDYVTLLSYIEIGGKTSWTNSVSPYLLYEGSQYEYWRSVAKVTGEDINYDALKKGQSGVPGVFIGWWTRSLRRMPANAFVRVNQNGNATGGSDTAANAGFGVCPAFCL